MKHRRNSMGKEEMHKTYLQRDFINNYQTKS